MRGRLGRPCWGPAGRRNSRLPRPRGGPPVKVSVVKRASALSVVATLALAGTAGAVIALPSDGSQVNNDPANGIDPNQNAGVSDVVGGSLAAGGARVPWATFEQQAGGAQRILVRAFKNGQWVTQGPS